MRHEYNKISVQRLGEILAPDCPKKYQEIFAERLKGECIPWETKETEISKEELISYVAASIKESFKPYEGSCNGAIPHDNRRRLLYGVLWGETTADSLMNDDFTHRWEGISCNYNEKTKTFSLSLLRDGEEIAYSKRQLDWCRKQVPDTVSDISDYQVIEMMYPAWKRFGDFSTSLPREIELNEKEQEFVRKLWEGLSSK